MAEVRRYKASYAAGGVATEMTRSCPLAPDERIVGEGRIRIRRGRRSPLGYYRVSSDRLCVLVHRALGPDEILEVPRSCITHVRSPDGRGVVAVECSDGTTLRLGPFSWAQVFAAGGKGAGPKIDPRAAQAIYETLHRD